MLTYKLLTTSEILQYLTHFVDASLPSAGRICGIHFAANGEAVATDGRVMCCITDAWEYEDTAMRAECPHDNVAVPTPSEPTAPAGVHADIPAGGLTIQVTADLIKQLKLLPAPGAVAVEIDYDPEKVYQSAPAGAVRLTGSNNLTVTGALLDNTYPDYTRVAPDGLPGCSVVGLDPALLDKFTGWNKLTKTKGHDFVQLELHEGREGAPAPMTVRVSSNKNIRGLLMPVSPATFE